MTFVTKKHLPRRTFLRGMGVSLALPLLDSMVPAQTPLAKSVATPKSRFCGIYIPHGATMDKWMPAQEGAAFEFSESLKPLEKYRDRINVVTRLAHPLAGGVGSDAGIESNDLGSAAGLKDMLAKIDPRYHIHGEHELVTGLWGTTRMYELTAALVRRAYTDYQLRLVLGGNWARVLKDIWHAEG